MSLDSNVLIQAKNRDFPMDVAPGFWVAIDRAMRNGSIFVVQGVCKELCDGNDELADWMKARKDFAQDHRCVQTQEQYSAVAQVIDERRPRYKSAAVHKFHDEIDPWIIAHACVYGHTIVSLESANSERINKVAIPDVCLPLNVPCINTIDLLRHIGVRLILDEDS